MSEDEAPALLWVVTGGFSCPIIRQILQLMAPHPQQASGIVLFNFKPN